MPTTENGIRHGCDILPFSRQETGESTETSTTMAAILAITVVHDSDVSPEQRLVEILEQSGEVEVLDSEGTLAGLGIDPGDSGGNPAAAPVANDNAPAVVAR